MGTMDENSGFMAGWAYERSLLCGHTPWAHALHRERGNDCTYTLDEYSNATQELPSMNLPPRVLNLTPLNTQINVPIPEIQAVIFRYPAMSSSNFPALTSTLTLERINLSHQQSSF